LLPEQVWAVEEITDAPRLTIRQWHENYRTDRDHRMSDRWTLVLAAADHGLVQRADIIAIYEESGSNQGPQTGRSTGGSTTGGCEERGVSVSVATAEPPASSKVSMLVLRK
jgi:hypothetical protein